MPYLVKHFVLDWQKYSQEQHTGSSQPTSVGQNQTNAEGCSWCTSSAIGLVLPWLQVEKKVTPNQVKSVRVWKNVYILWSFLTCVCVFPTVMFCFLKHTCVYWYKYMPCKLPYQYLHILLYVHEMEFIACIPPSAMPLWCLILVYTICIFPPPWIVPWTFSEPKQKYPQWKHQLHFAFIKQ